MYAIKDTFFLFHHIAIVEKGEEISKLRSIPFCTADKDRFKYLTYLYALDCNGAIIKGLAREGDKEVNLLGPRVRHCLSGYPPQRTPPPPRQPRQSIKLRMWSHLTIEITDTTE